VRRSWIGRMQAPCSARCRFPSASCRGRSWPGYSRPPGLSGTSRGHLSRLGRLTRRTAKRRWTKVPGESGFLRGAAYRNRTDDLRITRGMLPRSHSMTCTDSTTNGSDGPDCTGISRHPVPRPVPRLSHRPRLATVVSSP